MKDQTEISSSPQGIREQREVFWAGVSHTASGGCQLHCTAELDQVKAPGAGQRRETREQLLQQRLRSPALPHGVLCNLH